MVNFPLLPRRRNNLLPFCGTYSSPSQRTRLFYCRGVAARLKKGLFGARKIKVVCHSLSSDGILPNPDKVRAVDECRTPANVEVLRSFLRL